jgi:hypothetical protein
LIVSPGGPWTRYSAETLDAVLAQGPGKHGLLHKGKLSQVMRGGLHPQQDGREGWRSAHSQEWHWTGRTAPG